MALLVSLGICLGFMIGLSCILGTKGGLEKETKAIVWVTLISFSVVALALGIKVTGKFLIAEEKVVEIKANQ